MAEELPDAPWVLDSELPDAPWVAEAKPEPLKPSEEGGILSTLGDAVSAVHKQGAKSFSHALEGASNLNPFGHGDELPPTNPLESFVNTGKGLAGVASLPFAYPMGAASAMVGHPVSSLMELVQKGVQKLYPTAKPMTHEEIYEKMQPDIETALSALGSRGAGAPRAVPPGTGIIRDNARLLTEEGRRTRAGQVIESNASDPEALRASLESPDAEIVPGSAPTTFQQSGDLGIGGLERASATESPAAFIERRGEQNAARLEALRESQKSGSPEAVADNLRSAMREDNARTETAFKDAEHRAWEESHTLGGNHDPQIYGNVIRRELQQAEEGMRAQERELWNAVDPDGSFVARTGPIKRAHNDIYEPMSAAARTTMIDKETELAELINGYGPSVPFREMTDLRSAVTTAMREERMAHGSSPAYNRLVRLRVGLENAIVNDVMDMTTGSFTRAASERLRAASNATRERAQTFNAKPIKEIMRRDGLEGVYRLQEGAVPGKIISPGPTGYDNVSAFMRAVGNEEALPVVRDAAVASMRRAASNPDGTINPQRLQRWLDRHQDVMRAIEERDGGALQRQMSEAGTATKAVEDVAATRKTIMDEHNRGAFGNLIEATDKEDISKTVGRMLGSDNAVANMRSLSRKLTTPEAKEGARQAIADWVQEKFISNTEAGTSEQKLIRADQFQQFLKTKRAALQQIFTPDQLNTWQAIADDINRANRSISSSKLAGQSNTAQDLYAIKNAGLKMSLLHRAIAYLAAGVGGGLTGGVGVIAGLVGAHYAMSLREAGIKSVQQLVTQAMLDPALARELLSKAAGKEKVHGLKRYSMYQSSGVNRGEEEKK